MNSKRVLGVTVAVTLVAALGIITPLSKPVNGYMDPNTLKNEKAPPSIVGDNVY
jgi:hypothetical protein